MGSTHSWIGIVVAKFLKGISYRRCKLSIQSSLPFYSALLSSLQSPPSLFFLFLSFPSFSLSFWLYGVSVSTVETLVDKQKAITGAKPKKRLFFYIVSSNMYLKTHHSFHQHLSINTTNSHLYPTKILSFSHGTPSRYDQT